MPPRIAYNHDHFASPTALVQPSFQKPLETRRIERVRRYCHPPPIRRTNRTKDGGLLVRWGMEYDGIHVLRRNPQGTTRSMLLQVAFVRTPQVNILFSG